MFRYNDALTFRSMQLQTQTCDTKDILILMNIVRDPNAQTNCKIVLLGNSGVGKTSLAIYWATGEVSLKTNPTIGANHQLKTLNINGEDINIYLWDTSGQEQFQSLTPLYAQSSAAAILTASIVDEDSFENLNTWINLLNNSCDKIPPIVLVVNKCDLDEKTWKYEKEYIYEKYGERFNNKIFFVSAVTGEGVENAFLEAAIAAVEFIGYMSEPQKKTIDINARKEGKCC